MNAQGKNHVRLRWLLAGLALVLTSAAGAMAAERVSIATPSRGLFEFPVVVAMRKGFYKDEGFDVDKVQMQPTLGVKALLTGDVDYLLAWGSALRAAVTGVPIKNVVGIASRPLHVLIARAGIQNPKDLRNKVIGVDSVAGTVDYLARVAVRHFGMEPDKDVKIIVTGESPTRLAALRSGAIDATPIDVAFAVKAEDEGFRRMIYLGDLIELPLSGMAVTGVPVKNVVGIASRPLHVLIARPSIQSPQDLRNRVIGVDSVAGTVDYLSRVAVRHFGMEPDRDVKIIVTGESPTRLAALRSGAIDATPIDVAFAVKAEDEGFRRMIYLGDLIELPLSGMAVTDHKLQTQRDQVRRMVRATVRGTRYFKQNRSETVQMLADYLHISPSQAARAYDTSLNSFTDDGMISDKGVNLDVQLTKERLKMTKEIPLSQLVDWSLVREIK